VTAVRGWKRPIEDDQGRSQVVVNDSIAAKHDRRSAADRLWTTASVGLPEFQTLVLVRTPLRLRGGPSRRSVNSDAICYDGRTTATRKIRPLDFDVGARAPQPQRQALRCRGRFCAKRAFPYNSDAPAVLAQSSDYARVPISILLQFPRPELRSSLRELKVRAADMRVPEASMHEHDSIPLRKYEVGLARELLAMQPVPESSAPKQLPEAQLGAGVLCPNK